MVARLLLTFAICRLIVTVGLNVEPAELLRLGFGGGHVSTERHDLEAASLDFGLMARAEASPLVVFHPSLAEDVA
ncbi:hypothetical protein CRG98_044461, partial [Punica granatum]